MSERVEIHGLRELRAGLRAIDRNLPKELSKAGKQAARLVADEARGRFPIGPAAGGHARTSIKPRGSQKGAGVVEGGARYPYAPWLDFGGRIHPQPNQEIVRPRLQKGRYVWAAFADNRQHVIDTYTDALREVARNAGVRTDI